MNKPTYRKDMRASVSAEDLPLILSAIAAYSHNHEYRELLLRLQAQASALGVA